jgi:hypothetical protein
MSAGGHARSRRVGGGTHDRGVHAHDQLTPLIRRRCRRPRAGGGVEPTAVRTSGVGGQVERAADRPHHGLPERLTRVIGVQRLKTQPVGLGNSFRLLTWAAPGVEPVLI